MVLQVWYAKINPRRNDKDIAKMDKLQSVKDIVCYK